jgi:hypothetical protein
MRRFIRAALALVLTVAFAQPANANSSSYTVDQVVNSPTTFTVNDMTNTLLASTSTAIQFRFNYTTLALPGKLTITPGTISGTHNAFSPTNVKVSCSKLSGTGTLSGLSNVALTAGGVTCATMPTNSTGGNIIVQLTITIDDTALAPSAFGADTYTGSLTISGLDG